MNLIFTNSSNVLSRGFSSLKLYVKHFRFDCDIKFYQELKKQSELFERGCYNSESKAIQIVDDVRSRYYLITLSFYNLKNPLSEYLKTLMIKIYKII
jgi:hypothetical protein